MLREILLSGKLRWRSRAIGTQRLAWPVAAAVIAVLSIVGWLGIAYLVHRMMYE
jgi:polyferredoxin